MSELQNLLERRDGSYQPPADLRERVLTRARRRQRIRRAGTALAVVLLTAVMVNGWSRLFPPTTTVVFDPPSDRQVGAADHNTDVAVIDAPANGGFWPQSSLDEVRQAQRQADAGAPDHAWQVRPLEDAGFHGDAEIFHVFLMEALGWEQFRWGAHPLTSDDVEGSFDVRFVRCDAGQPNALYPTDVGGNFATNGEDLGCAPTLDEFTYETVDVSLYQPLGDDEDGLWAIRGWQRAPAVRQAEPPSAAEVAATIEPFLQARLDGEGAEQYLESPAAEIALLYTTSSGARYDRFDYEVGDAQWPRGDVEVSVRLFAGADVVEQVFLLNRGSGRLEYDSQSMENGAPAAEPYLVGPVTYSVPDAWHDDLLGPFGEDTIAHFNVDVDVDHDLVVVLDALAPTGRCGWENQPASAAELVRSIRSSRTLVASAPVAARIGAIDALQLDVNAADEAAACGDGEATVLAPRRDPDNANDPSRISVGPDERARLYLFDTPGPRPRTVAILLVAPEPAFERVFAAAQPIIDSFELSTE